NDDADLSIAATSASLPEGNSGNTAFAFTVTRTGNLNSAASANFAVTGSGTNKADANDFGGTLPSGTVSFAAGEATKTITVNVRGDGVVEFDETFNVTLSNPTGANIRTASAIGTIVADDTLIEIEGDNNYNSYGTKDLSKAEGNSGTIPFTVTVDRIGK